MVITQNTGVTNVTNAQKKILILMYSQLDLILTASSQLFYSIF